MAARRPPVLLGRAGERQVLDRLLDNVRGGQSAVVFTKLGITSRMGLHDALPSADHEAAPA